MEKKKLEDDGFDFLDEKKSDYAINKKYSERSLFRKILNIVVWLIVFVVLSICILDFIRVKMDKDPKFCIKNTTVKYEDGNVKCCFGLGYKVYNYNRKSYRKVEYVPIWSKDKSTK